MRLDGRLGGVTPIVLSNIVLHSLAKEDCDVAMASRTLAFASSTLLFFDHLHTWSALNAPPTTILYNAIDPPTSPPTFGDWYAVRYVIGTRYAVEI